MQQRIRCDDVSYRKGLIEVTPGIHSGCINLETWTIHPDIGLDNKDIRNSEIPEESITGNTEIELNARQAEELIAALQLALSQIDQ